MPKTAFVYPGQGSQEKGMATDFYNESRIFKKTLDHMERNCDFELRNLCLNTSNKNLQRTRNTQPAILATGIAAHAAVANHTSITPNLVSGHSLGQFTALATVGGISISDCVDLVRKRGKLMEMSSSDKNGEMYAVLFADRDTVSKLCSEFESASIAASNTTNQTVISGSSHAIQKVQKKITNETRAKFIKLDTDEAFHSPLMKDAAVEFSKILNGESINKEFRIPIISDVNGRVYKNGCPLIEALSNQIVSKVDWMSVMETIEDNDIDVIVEFPPAGTLSNFLKEKFTNKIVISLNTPNDIIKLKKLQ